MFGVENYLNKNMKKNNINFKNRNSNNYQTIA